MSSPIAALVLAAGKGTRMKSEMPKGLHKVCSKPMAEWVGRALRGAGADPVVIVVGHGGDAMIEALGESYHYAWQREQLGTGHAALMAADALQGFRGPVVVAAGDTPLITSETIRALVQAHQAAGAKATVATAIVCDPRGYGRIVRESGAFARIVEEKDASPDEKAIAEVNAGLYVFEAEDLFRILPTLRAENAQGEYYLTDVLAQLVAEGATVEATAFDDPDLMMGVNDRWQLSQAERVLRMRLLREHALNGVTIVDPDSTYIGPDVEIGPDTVIEPQTYLTGPTRIGRGCHIGPSTRIKRCEIGDGCFIFFSHLMEATLRDGVKVGPFAHLRPGAVLEEKVRIGNFVEVKNAVLGPSAAANHLSYIGDAEVGARTNVGAGTITCNYDGFQKHRTTIGSDVFVGSHSTLVAPVTIEDGSMVAAGSVVTQDVPSGALAIGRGRQENKEQWATQWRNLKKTAGSKSAASSP